MIFIRFQNISGIIIAYTHLVTEAILGLSEGAENALPENDRAGGQL